MKGLGEAFVKYISYETDQTLALPLSLSTHATSPPLPSLLSVLFSVTSSFPQVSPPPLHLLSFAAGGETAVRVGR